MYQEYLSGTLTTMTGFHLMTILKSVDGLNLLLSNIMAMPLSAVLMLTKVSTEESLNADAFIL